MPRTFGKYPCAGVECPTRQESHAAGWEAGLTWKHDYRPGGPWTTTVASYSRSEQNDPDWVAYVAALKENSICWFEGFDAGIRQRDRHKLARSMHGA